MLTRMFRASIAPILLAVVSCTDSVVDPPAPVEGEFTVDASANWVYVNLGDSTLVTPTPSARESSAWDIAFFATNVTTNGGEAGPGSVSVACICQNASATNAEILAMTPASEQGDFDAVTSVPATATFTTDALTPAMSQWYTGTGTGASANPDRVFLVRLSDGTSYAKVHVIAIQGASATSAGQVTLEYAVQTSGTASFGPTQTITLSGTAAAVGADFNTSSTTSASTWDVKLDGWNLLVNGGVSGPGSAAVAIGSQPFGETTTAVTTPQAYQTDRYAGVFGTRRWYKYNLAGDNRISPTFDVYLLKRGARVYKLQITNYYGVTGQARVITFRYQRIAG